jgi:hypothetical protein
MLDFGHRAAGPASLAARSRSREVCGGHQEGKPGSARVFEGLSKTDLKYLLDITKIVHHAEGHTIISEGESGVGIHLILEGEARVVRGADCRSPGTRRVLRRNGLDR